MPRRIGRTHQAAPDWEWTLGALALWLGLITGAVGVNRFAAYAAAQAEHARLAAPYAAPAEPDLLQPTVFGG